MRIAIDCRLMALPGAAGNYTGSVLIPRLLQKGVGHQFLLIFDRAFSPEWIAYPNATCLVLKPAAGSAATRGFWYDHRLPSLLSTHQIDVFLGMAGYISLRSPVRQFLWLHDALGAAAGDEDTGWLGNWYKRRLPDMIKKAMAVGVAAGTHNNGNLHVGDNTNMGRKMEGVVGDNTNNGGKMQVLPVSFVPGEGNIVVGMVGDNIVGDNTNNGMGDNTNNGISDNTNNRMSGLGDLGGMPYFLCIEGWQTMEDGVALLLAFSGFKKRMQSGMKLVLAGTGPREREWQEKLASYRYRDDLVVLPQVSGKEAAVLLQAAYALIHLPLCGKVKWLLAAMQCQIPVITRALPGFLELGADALMYCTDAPGESLAQNLMRMYKDEKTRATIIQKGKTIASHMTPDEASGKILAFLESTF